MTRLKTRGTRRRLARSATYCPLERLARAYQETPPAMRNRVSSRQRLKKRSLSWMRKSSWDVSLT